MTSRPPLVRSVSKLVASLAPALLAVSGLAPGAQAQCTVTATFDKFLYQPGESITLTITGPPGKILVLIDTDAGPTFIPGPDITVDIGFSDDFTALCPYVPGNGILKLTGSFSCLNPFLGQVIHVSVVSFDHETMTFCISPPVSFKVEDTTGVCEPACLLIIDEDTIDNDISTIEDSADGHGMEADFLVNDDQPTEVGNPALRWNELFPGDVVLLPGGQVDDEGWFALPPNAPWSVGAFAAGTVPQSQLDKIKDVMPIRNQELFKLIGRTCTAVVYDSDISINYLPLDANLQGARYGLFTFRVLDVVVAGSLPESGSSTSLYDLLVRVEPPKQPTEAYVIPKHDHEPDSVQIVKAKYLTASGKVEVHGTSQFGASAVMTVSIDGFVLEAAMSFQAGLWRYTATTSTNLKGRRVTISSDHGGAYNAVIQ